MSDIMGLWVILRVEIVHGRQCTMSMEFVHSFMRRCCKNSMDNVHSTLDIVPGLHGHCPHIPWVPWTLSTHSMGSMDNVHAFCGKYPWIPWKMSRKSMESMDFLQTGGHHKIHIIFEWLVGNLGGTVRMVEFRFFPIKCNKVRHTCTSFVIQYGKIIDF